MKVIGISAKAEHGKTFTCNVLKEMCEEQGLSAAIIPLAGTLKEYARKLDWDGQKDDRGRSLLQELGPVLKHYHGGECFARWAYERAIRENIDVLLIDDMRLTEEVGFYDRMLAEGKVEDYHLYRVVRPNYENRLNEKQRQDISETALDNYNFEKVLINDGTDNFKQIIKQEIPI